MHKENGHTVESRSRRVQASGRPVLMVLVASLVLVCGLYVLIYLGYFSGT